MQTASQAQRNEWGRLLLNVYESGYVEIGVYKRSDERGLERASRIIGVPDDKWEEYIRRSVDNDHISP